MRKLRYLAPIMATGLVLGLAACGDDDDKDKKSDTGATTGATTGTGPNTGTGSTAPAGDFEKQANEACSSFQSRLNDLQKDAQDVSTNDQRAEVLGNTSDLLGELDSKLKSITPPADKQAKYDELVAAFSEVQTKYGDAADAFKAGDTAKARELTQAGVTASAKGVTLSTELKLPACGSGS